LPLTIVQGTADEATALRRHIESDYAAHHSPDLFHLQREVAKATGLALTRAVPVLKIRTRLHALSTQALAPLLEPDHPIQALDTATRAHLEQLADECPDLFQRSSSAVEGRNGQLSLHHHGRHRLSDRKLAALTAVHNFHIRRADGATAAERLFARAPPPLFEQVLARLPLPPRPRRRRPPRPKVPYLTPLAA
jgi:hypothetical protein